MSACYDSVLPEFPVINDRLAHLPQMVCGWLDALPPALVREVVRVAHTGTGGSPYNRLHLQDSCHSEPVLKLVWESPSSLRTRSSKDGDCHASVSYFIAMTRIKRPRSSIRWGLPRQCALLYRNDPEVGFAMTGNSIPRQCAKRSFTAKTIPSGWCCTQ